ncbi:hypothetical protein BJV74DRAFT_813806 [Russula compacta]|nr:hypothetical protein BJV74DRAFT_813806 [Russula compacta]
MSSRWFRDEEDSDRLPHGMIRTGYDADMHQYYFLDTTTGVSYVSEPGNRYGTLTPADNFPKQSRSTGRRRTLQAYDRPVVFADDKSSQLRSSPSMGHKSTPSSPSHHSSSTRKHGRKRTASFSDFLPAHLIASASSSSTTTAAAGRPAAESSYVRTEKRPSKTAPSSPQSPPPPYTDEKKYPLWSPTEALWPTLPSQETPPPLPPKDNPVSPVSGRQPVGGVRMPRAALRTTSRIIGRTLEAVKGCYRSHPQQPKDDGWVVL